MPTPEHAASIRPRGWLDGRLGGLDELFVSVEDRSYLFADGVYEVVRMYDGVPFAWKDHLDRLERSAAGIELPMPRTQAQLAEILATLLQDQPRSDAEIYIQVSRGAARRHHLFPANTPASLLMWVQPLKLAAPALKQTGVVAVTRPDERWARCHLKTVSLLPNVLAKEEAKRAGAFEALLVRDGKLTEGTSCNAFLVLDGALVSPVTDNRILPGITRDHLLALAPTLGIAVVQRDIPIADLERASEVFLTSTLMEVMPVTTIDGRAVGDGKPGAVTQRLAAAFSAHIAAQTAAQVVPA